MFNANLPIGQIIRVNILIIPIGRILLSKIPNPRTNVV